MKKITSLKGEDISINFHEIPLLSNLSDEEAQAIQNEVFFERVPKGEAVFHIGDKAEKMYIIYEGNMKVSMLMADGREQLLYLYRPGDFVGGLNILTGDRYVYEGVALTDSLIVTLNKYDLTEVLLKNQHFVFKLLEKSYERIRTAEAMIRRMSVQDADSKVSTGLMNLIPLYGKETPEGILLDLTINREDLGSFAGISRETMSRKLNAFEQKGIISLLPKGHILIKDIEKLHQMMGY